MILTPISSENGGGDDPIVVVGTACRLPGEATSLQALWDMMSNERTGHVPVPAERWDADAWYHPDPDRKGAITSKAGFFLKEDIAAFDAPFFSVTSKEAEGMDPAKRLLLEVSYEALENAGMPMERVAGSRTGVYVGCMTSDYEDMSTHDIYDLAHNAAAGVSEAMTANRVSWFFDFRGPSLTVDTACSSSLYALHLACQSLQLGETDMNLVAGVNVILYPNAMSQLTAMHMLSPEGLSHSFDHRANGYGRGEGTGVIVLKRLSDALRDGDVIRAVIRASATNVDGRTPSVTMPSSEAQEDLIRTTYKRAGLPISETSYVELHGTGTPVGDPIELSAIAATFGASRSQPVYVGSIKPNVGHTEGCAGIAGVLRAIASLEKGEILPTAEIEKVNPRLTFDDWNLALPSKVLPWPAVGTRRVSVNSFGFGGANAHVIMDDAYHYLKEHDLTGFHSTTLPKTNELEEANGHASETAAKKLLVVSSRDQQGLQRIAKQYGSLNKYQPSVAISDLAHTFSNKRSFFDYRSFVAADTLQELSLRLERPLPIFRRPTKLNGIVFVFTGQGAQWAGMGKELIDFPVFAESITKSGAYLTSLGCLFDLRQELQNTYDSKIDSPEYSQPICSAVQIALVDLLRDWSITPRAVIGHSSGEIAASYAAGITTHEDAIKVAYFRGIYSLRVAESSRRGGMLAAGISAEEAQEYLKAVPKGSVVTACVNSPNSVTLSGDVDRVTDLEKLISNEGKFARKLRVSTAYHSPHMQSVASECLAAMDRSGFSKPQKSSVLMFSSVTGALVDPQTVDTSYWIRNMCQSVLFSPALDALLTYSPNRRSTRRLPYKWNSVLEIGPHSALKAPIVQTMEGVEKNLPADLPYISMLTRKEHAIDTALKAAGGLWALGNPILLNRVNREEGDANTQTLVNLPPYPWNHENRYWHEASNTRSERLKKQPRSDLLGVPVPNQNPFEPQWKNYLRLRENPWISDHAITGTTLYPGAGMLIMVLEAAQQIVSKGTKIEGIEFIDVHFERGLVVPSEGAVETRLSINLSEGNDKSHSFAIFSVTGNSSWTKHCYGYFSIQKSNDGVQSESATLDWERRLGQLHAVKKDASQTVNIDKLYQDLHKVGMEYGDTFRNLTSLTATPDASQCYGTVKIPDTKSVMPFEFEYPHIIHPATLDAIFHLMVHVVSDGGTWTDAAVPYRLQRLFIATDQPQNAGTLFSGYAGRHNKTDNGLLGADLVVSDESWQTPKIIVDGLLMKKVTASGSSSSEAGENQIAKRCTVLTWELDPTSFVHSPDSSSLSIENVNTLQDWLQIECHKSPGLTVLIDGNALGPILTDELLPFISGASSYRAISQLTITGSNEETLDPWRKAIADVEADSQVTFHVSGKESGYSLDDAKFHLIITASSGHSAESSAAPWVPALQQEGRLLILSQGKPDLGAEKPVTNGFSYPKVQARSISLKTGTIDIIAVPREPCLNRGGVCLLLPRTYIDSQAASLEIELERSLLNRGISVRKAFADMADDLTDQHIISLLDLGQPAGFLSHWTKDEFESFKTLLNTVKHLCWLSRAGQMLSPDEAGLGSAPTTGFLRVLRNELPQVTITHVDLTTSFNSSKAEAILNLWIPLSLDESDSADLEYAEFKGEFYIPRTVPAPSFDSEIALATGAASAEPTLLGDAGHLQLVNEEGAALVWKLLPGPETKISPEEVDIKVTNVSTTVGRSFTISSPQALWTQTTGVVSACGSSVSELSPGDHVVVLGPSNCQNKLRVHWSKAHTVPVGVALDAAATTIWLYALALYILEHVVRLQVGENILVCDGLTPLTQALLSLSSTTGANIFTTVSSQADKKIVESLGIPVNVIVDFNSTGVSSYLLHETGGRGIDALIAPAHIVTKDLSAFMADFGRIASIIGTGDDHGLPRSLGRRNLTYSLVQPAQILEEHPETVTRLLRKRASLLNAVLPASKFTPALQVFSVSQFPDAAERCGSSKEDGIVSVAFPDDALVPVLPPKPQTLELPADGTYVLAGGLGSLGLRIAKLMAQHGARHIVLLSRSGNNPKWDGEIAVVESIGASVEVLKCDVTKADEVEDAINSLYLVGRRIRGVVQCAMVLQDSIFSTMTHDQWQKAFTPKVAGTWHLHNSLTTTIDFFILLSSVVSVIGNVSQANYAAGNAWMDAFAHYRRSLGKAAVSLNVGLVRDSDHTIDGTNMDSYLDRFGHMASVSTTLDELDIGLLACMRGHTADGSPIPPQVVYGMTDVLRREGPVVDQWTRDRKFDHRVTRLNSSAGAATGDGASGAEVKAALGNAKSGPEAGQVVIDAFKRLLAPGLGVQPAAIGDDQPMFELGVDSFKAVEIRNHVFRELKSEISVFEILSSKPLEELSILIAMRSQLVTAEAKAA